jgi:predicted enzyme involved in methoxymalonyl-ACP biosynthesis
MFTKLFGGIEFFFFEAITNAHLNSKNHTILFTSTIEDKYLKMRTINMCKSQDTHATCTQQYISTLINPKKNSSLYFFFPQLLELHGIENKYNDMYGSQFY